MNISEEMIKEFQEKMTNATSSEEVVQITKELGKDISLEEATAFLKDRPVGVEPLSDDELEQVSGGEDIDIPQYEIITDYYKEKGPNLAFILCIYYIPSPLCYEIIQVIEEEVAAGRL